ncbi:hypothetical protein ABIA65_006713 [Mycolicibacterium sp. 624]
MEFVVRLPRQLNDVRQSTLLGLLAGVGADGGPDVTGTVDHSPP